MSDRRTIDLSWGKLRKIRCISLGNVGALSLHMKKIYSFSRLIDTQDLYHYGLIYSMIDLRIPKTFSSNCSHFDVVSFRFLNG